MRKERATRRAERVEASASVFRAGSDQPRHEDPPARSYPAKKDKKRWCGGHVGRHHIVVVGRKKALGAAWSRVAEHVPVIRYCRACGKEFDTWFFGFNRFLKRPPPAWVEDFLEKETRGA